MTRGPLRSGSLLCTLLGAVCTLCAEASQEASDAASPFRFVDATVEAGVEFRGPDSKEKRYILESMSGGVALVDLDRDGDLDLYLVGHATIADMHDGRTPESRLYVNRGDGTFENAPSRSGARATGWGTGVCAGDVDGDGRLDLYVTGIEKNHLFVQRDGEGLAFEDATRRAEVAGGGWSTGCTFADVEGDGDLDLFVARYLDLRLDALPNFGDGEICRYRDVPVQCGPRGIPGLSDLFYRNDGTGRFEEASKAAGLADEGRLYGLGAVFFDFDHDGDPDLFVANDTGPNFLYQNRGDGTFEEVAPFLGVAVSEDGLQQGSMGVAIGDYRNDGWPSLFVTNFSEEYNAFYAHQEGEYFVDASFSTRTAAGSLPRVGWGTAFFDVDNDGWLDLLLVNGHVYPQADQIRREASAPYRQAAMLYRNLRDGTFEEVELEGPLAEPRSARGLAVGDIDLDGRLDLVITDLDAETRVLRNATPDAGHWLLVDLVGRPPRRDAIGARLTLRAGDLVQTREVRSGGSYLSQHDLRQHFGLGERTRVDAIEILWPDGSTSKHGPFSEVDRILTLEQASPTPENAKKNADPESASERP